MFIVLIKRETYNEMKWLFLNVREPNNYKVCINSLKNIMLSRIALKLNMERFPNINL